jgi:hypothetical protein
MQIQIGNLNSQDRLTARRTNRAMGLTIAFDRAARCF